MADGMLTNTPTLAFLTDELAKAHGRIMELRAALLPFAECAGHVPDGWEDDHGLGDWALALDVADLRAAKRALEL
ncbi:MAG: hypothetical protein KGL39_55940 [Patescibacteria group bacterium]|nr:hypothetical protein [Patescibacteria group bacterium]